MKIWKRDYYEKLLNIPAKTVEDYYEIIRKAQAKISELQENCSHDKTFVGMHSWRVGAFYPAVICNSCHKPVGKPSDEESTEVWKKWNGTL